MSKLGSLPSFIHIPDGTLHDVPALDRLIPEAGAIFVMDRSSLEVVRLRVLPRAYSTAPDRPTGVRGDRTIAFDGISPQQTHPAPLRRLRFRALESAKTRVCLAKRTPVPALTLCARSKSRWQVE